MGGVGGKGEGIEGAMREGGGMVGERTGPGGGELWW